MIKLWLLLILFIPLFSFYNFDALAEIDPSEYDVIQDKQNYDRLDNYRTADFELAKVESDKLTKVDTRLEYTIGILSAIGLLVLGVLLKRKLHLIIVFGLLLIMFTAMASAPYAWCEDCYVKRCQVNVQCWDRGCGDCNGDIFRCMPYGY